MSEVYVYDAPIAKSLGKSTHSRWGHQRSESKPATPPLTPDTFRYQWKILGLSVAQHPVTPFRSFLKTQGYQTSHDLQKNVGATVKICGIPATSRSIPLGNGQEMCFYTLADEDGLFEVAVPAGLYHRIKLDLAQIGNHALCVTIVVETEFGAVTCRATEVLPLARLIATKLEENQRRAG